jgi:hypothetical protein
MLLILVIGYLSSSFIAAMVTNGHDVFTAALIVFAALVISGVLWSYVNWILSLAPIFLVRDALSPLDSVVAAIGFIHRNRSRLTAIALWNGTLRGLAATVISIAGVGALALQLALPPSATTVLLVLETIAYLAISDIFLLARLAAYASVAVHELVLAKEFPVFPDSSGTTAL